MQWVTESIWNHRDSQPVKRRSTCMARFPSQPVIEILAWGRYHPLVLLRGLWSTSFWTEPTLAESNFDVIAQGWAQAGSSGLCQMPSGRCGCCCQVNWLNLRGHQITFVAAVFSLLFAFLLKRRRAGQVTECLTVVHQVLGNSTFLPIPCPLLKG